jgi:hypothetical protein
MKLEDGGILRGFDSGVRQAPEQWLVFAAPYSTSNGSVLSAQGSALLT